MRIDRRYFNEDSLNAIYITNKRNEPYLTRQNYIFFSRRSIYVNRWAWLQAVSYTLGLAVFAFFFSTILLNEWNDYVLLANEGETTQAILIKKETTRVRANDVYNFTWLYHVNNQSYFFEINVDHHEFETTAEGAYREITYASSEPSLATFDINDNLGGFVVPRNFLFLVVLCHLLYWAYIIFAKVPLMAAKIVSIEPYAHQVLFWKSHWLKLQFEYVSPKTGKLISSTHRIPDNNPPRPGQLLALIHLNDKRQIVL